MHRPLLLASAATLLLSGCGDKKPSSASTARTKTTATKKKNTLPSECAVNADGTIRFLDRKANRGFIKANRLGSRIRFRPKTDIYKGPVKKGDGVYFTFKKTAPGGTAVCLIAKVPAPAP